MSRSPQTCRGVEAQRWTEDPSKGRLSGSDWVREFPDSQSLGDVPDPAQSTLRHAIRDLQSRGAQVSIRLLVRPRQRAYLMHYAWDVAQGMDPTRVPAMDGVAIQWTHRHADCSVDWDASRTAAQQMVRAYGLQREPALQSRHGPGFTVQLRISWNTSGSLLDSGTNS
jgi:hypothetical protein